MKLSLDGSWQLYFFPQGDFSFDNPQALFDSDLTPIHALVPGNVELDLQRAGLLPEPYEAANIRLLRPCENDEWWYVR